MKKQKTHNPRKYAPTIINDSKYTVVVHKQVCKIADLHIGQCHHLNFGKKEQQSNSDLNW